MVPIGCHSGGGYFIRGQPMMPSHDDRLKVLESEKAEMRGAMWALGAIITTVAGFVSWMVSYLRG